MHTEKPLLYTEWQKIFETIGEKVVNRLKAKYWLFIFCLSYIFLIMCSYLAFAEPADVVFGSGQLERVEKVSLSSFDNVVKALENSLETKGDYRNLTDREYALALRVLKTMPDVPDQKSVDYSTTENNAAQYKAKAIKLLTQVRIIPDVPVAMEKLSTRINLINRSDLPISVKETAIQAARVQYNGLIEQRLKLSYSDGRSTDWTEYGELTNQTEHIASQINRLADIGKSAAGGMLNPVPNLKYFTPIGEASEIAKVLELTAKSIIGVQKGFNALTYELEKASGSECRMRKSE